VSNSCDELLWRNSYDELLWSTPIPDSNGRLLFRTARANSFYRLLLQTASIINPSCFHSLGDPLLVCSFPRYMHFYRPLLSSNNTPLLCLPRLFCLQNCWEQFSCIRGDIILMNYVSVAWQWAFPALGNSAFQTCHNILHYVIIVTEFNFCASVTPTSQTIALDKLLLPTAGNYKCGILGGLRCHNFHVKFIHNYPVVL
jgi:hypothetical protein